jgi:hypothetical protein
MRVALTTTSGRTASGLAENGGCCALAVSGSNAAGRSASATPAAQRLKADNTIKADYPPIPHPFPFSSWEKEKE